MICIHHNDLDGRCCAAQVHAWADISDGMGARFKEMDYKDSFDPATEIRVGEQVWIVDFSFKPEVMRAILARTPRVVWIDHHKSAIEKYEGFEYRVPGLRDISDAACVLTWEYIHWYSDRGSLAPVVGVDYPRYTAMDARTLAVPVPYAVELLGDYDAWHHKYEVSTLFYEGLKLQDSAPDSEDWWPLWEEPDTVQDVIAVGRACVRYRDAYCGEMNSAYGFETSVDGHKVWACNIQRFGSLGFGKRMDEYPICCAFVYDGAKCTVSLYTKRSDIDVSLICKARGGGGHKGAAGYVADRCPKAGEPL